ncbi:MAG TPA: Asp-tRNA(Asn)/Glu-tRNA(Gln) amidotransferase GatCAB subunit B, partial [Actinomycetota bacterium]|nr:Asp-tRNA(Asn)/Glu-tRNA(Gln) amidotransferase GatCAB subunit B [Actinomycetota bacterium]
EESGIRQVSDEGALEEGIDAVLAANPDVVERLKAGDNKPFGYLMGEVMKATKGQGNPKVVSGLIRKKLGAGG